MVENVLQRLNEDFVHCAICREPYKEPKMLPCLHSFCLQCLERWISHLGQSLSCPTCRLTVDLPSTGIKGLPNNLFVISLTERLQEVRRILEEHQNRNCNICRYVVRCYVLP
ncbi:Tripartite motif-containing protein 2 [Holothuria leucospilota]|uniref:Tripartite motif-containing protein 2 n=1 Tax=Holothuria leucospilota TaxID=206669 RepID=A0A9Q0YGL6_HOLLE|nr:Tripartite motif-containing protein 2 [Holothuria leucospilota]